MATRLVRFAGCAVAAWLGPFLFGVDPASAQWSSTFPLRSGSVENLTDDPSYDPVMTRPRPEYDPVGLHVRSFFVMPSVSSTLIFDDNVFATGSSKESDWTLHTRPEIVARSDWSSHDLQMRFTLDNYLNKQFSDEDHTDIEGELSGRVDVLRNLNLTGRAAYTHATIERGTDDSVLKVDQPIDYDEVELEGFVNAAFGRLFASAGTKARRSDYDDTSINATVFDQDYRDGTVVEAIGRLGYEVTMMTGVFVQFSYNTRRFDDSFYDSDGIRAVGGLAFEASRLIKGEIFAGYLGQSYDSGVFDDLQTWTYGAKLAWQPTPLITVSLEGTREADQSSFNNGSSVVDNEATLRTDYELRRNIILSGILRYQASDYQGPRLDTTLSVSGAARYLINRRFSVGVEATHTRFESDFAEDYERNRIGITGRFQF